MWLLILCLFWAVLGDKGTRGDCECKKCLARSSDHCEYEDTEKCTTGCATVSGFLRNETEEIPFIYKGCKPEIPCDSWLCVSMGGASLQAYVKCCEGEKCNPEYFILNDTAIDPNGMFCESCYKEGTEKGCSSDVREPCYGDDTLCVNYGGNVSKPDGRTTEMSFKGCANPIGYENFNLFYCFHEMHREFFESYEATPQDP